jgi:hypothetical protein
VPPRTDALLLLHATAARVANVAAAMGVFTPKIEWIAQAMARRAMLSTVLVFFFFFFF